MSAGGAAATTTESYPAVTDEQLAQWKQQIVVAELRPGAYYKAKECPKNHICIGSPPFWLNAKVSATLYGDEPPAELRISTGSHYGMSSYGGTYLMPRYASAPLVRDKLGALYLHVTSKHAIYWLPCGVESLREQVFQENFHNGEEIATGDYKHLLAKTFPDLYQVNGKWAWPRYAIPVERLREYLLKAGPDVKMSCAPGSAAGKDQRAPLT